MGRAKRDFFIRKFSKSLCQLKSILSQSNDRKFLTLVWAVNILQSKHRIDVRRHLNYPIGAGSTSFDSPFLIYKWELETILSILLTTEKNAESTLFDYKAFSFISEIINNLRSVENYEYSIMSDDNNDLVTELHKTAHRQFPWQRGFELSERLYRFAYIYGQGSSDTFFKEKYKIDVKEFIYYGFMMYAQMIRSPWIDFIDIPRLDIKASRFIEIVGIFSKDLEDLRFESGLLLKSSLLNNKYNVSYTPSALRMYPIIRCTNSNKYISPLPQLILFRVTNGIYYDTCSAPQRVLEEANKRFENYTGMLINGFFLD